MPRPTPAQLAYGSATVVFSTLAMLLLSEAQSGIAVFVIATAGLVLGVLVAVTVTLPLAARAKHTTVGAAMDTAPAPLPRPRVCEKASGAPAREPSLRR